MIVRELHELARVEVRGAGRPRMRGLRHDGVVAAVGEPQCAARIVDDDVDARIGERIALAQRAVTRLASMTLGSSSMTSIWRTLGGTPSTTTPPPKPTISMSRALRARDHREWRQPEFTAEALQRSGAVHQRFGQAVGAQGQAAVLRQHHDARAAADVVIEHAPIGSDVERRSDQQGHRSLRPEERATGDGDHGNRDRENAIHGQQQPQRNDAQCGTGEHGDADRAFVAQLGNQDESRGERADDRADGVPRVDAGARRRGIGGVARQHAHGEWIGHADGEVMGSSSRPANSALGTRHRNPTCGRPTAVPRFSAAATRG